MRLKYKVILGFLLSLIGLGYYWISQHFEIRIKRVETGFQGPALQDPWLAAGYLLKEMGMKFFKTGPFENYYPSLHTEDAVVLLLTGELTLNQSQTKSLLNWVNQGGHLIVAGDPLSEDIEINGEHLLKRLGIKYLQNEDITDLEIQELDLTDFYWDGYDLNIAFKPFSRLEMQVGNPVREIKSQLGTHLLTSYFGKGIVTVLSDLEFMENEYIGQYDHAQFLWQLVHFSETVDRVWLIHPNYFLHGEIVPASQFLNLIWERLWTVWITILVLIILGLWSITRRFGPLLPMPVLERRRLLEHIEASGHFLWRNGQEMVLLESVKKSVLKRVRLLHPEWSHLSLPELTEQLILSYHLPAKEVRNVLISQGVAKKRGLEREISFVKGIQVLGQINKTIWER